MIPLSWKLWKGVATFAITQMHRSAGGDAIGLNATETGVEPLPVKYNANHDSEEGPRWVAKESDNWWLAGSEGRGVEYWGRTPLILLDDEGHQRVTVAEARIAEAVDLGHTRPLYANPEIEKIEIWPAKPGQAGADGAAVADGGEEYASSSYRVTDPGELEDVLIDPIDEGLRVSWRKVKELYQQKVPTEEMQMQEERGRIAEQDPEGDRKFAMKMMFYAMMIVLGAITLIFVVYPAIVSGGGGGVSLPSLALAPYGGLGGLL